MYPVLLCFSNGTRIFFMTYSKHLIKKTMQALNIFKPCRLLIGLTRKRLMENDRVIDILIVEDEMNSDLLTRRIREEFKGDVRVHKNGHGLLNDLKNYEDLDLIIVDHQYLKEDLVTGLRTVRKKHPATEVIVLSSEKEDKTVKGIREAGAYDYVYKDPSAIDKVLYIIRSFWTRRELLKENAELRSTHQRSKGIVAFLVFLVIVIIAAFIYLLVK